MNKSGFTLIELLIATFIASILGVLLFSALYQINSVVSRVNTTTSIYEKAALINAQLERDLSGATAPFEFYYRQREPDKKKVKQEEQKKEDAEKQEAEKKENLEGQKKPKKPLEKIFYSTNKDGMLDQLSFITTNPMQAYWSSKTGSAKPRVARVLYTLKEEKGLPKSYSLIRKESGNIEFDPIAQIGKEGAQEFVLVDGIKSLNIEYTYYVPEKKESSEPGKPEKKESESNKKREVKKSKEWITAQAEKEEAKQFPLLPQLVELKLALWDAQKKSSKPFTLKIRIPSDIPEKRETEDVTQKLLGTLREFFTQSFTPQIKAPTRVTQRNPVILPKGARR